MARTIAPHRTYKGWDIFYEPHHTGLNWTGRFMAEGLRFHADTLKGAKRAIDEAKWLRD